jgi:hypothetical protein
MLRKMILIVVGVALVLAGIVAAAYLLQMSVPESAVDPLTRKREAVRSELLDAVTRRSPTAAMDILRVRIKDPEIASICHALAHEIGQGAQRQLGTERALEIDDDICGSGYIHGIIETSFAEQGDPAAASKTFCKPKQGKCFHGLGHGIMYAMANDVPTALGLCDALPERSDRIQCSEGVFMENFNTDLTVHQTKYLRQDDPYFPCREPTEPYKGVCAFYAPRYYVRIHPGAYADALAWCATLPEGPRDGCAKGVGSVATKEHVDDPTFVESICLGGAPEQRRYCMEGLVSYTIVHYASVQKGRELCVQLDEEYKPVCESIAKQSEPFFQE